VIACGRSCRPADVGVLEALDATLRNIDGGALPAPDATEQPLAAQIQLRYNRRLQAVMRSSACRPSSSSTTSTSRFSRRCAVSRSRACTTSGLWSVARR
jgi:hypothetical protein